LLFLDRIGDVVTTPRAVKRLLNLYRMIRATQNLTSASAFLGSDAHPGDFQAVMVLLSLLCAVPGQAGAALGNLGRATGAWPEFAKDLGDPHGDERWQRLCRSMSGLAAVVGSPDLVLFPALGHRHPAVLRRARLTPAVVTPRHGGPTLVVARAVVWTAVRGRLLPVGATGEAISWSKPN
jgi:hypothetical protein